MPNLSEFTATTIDGEQQALGDFKDKVCLVVNVASKCGLTPQYDGLERLYGRFRAGGLEILAFPCNQFAGQEPGTEPEIREFCTTNYGVTFPLFAKVNVNGDDQNPLYSWLTSENTEPEGPGDVKWNFGKFLIDRSGQVVARFEPATEPEAEDVVTAVEAALG